MDTQRRSAPRAAAPCHRPGAQDLIRRELRIQSREHGSNHILVAVEESGTGIGLENVDKESHANADDVSLLRVGFGSVVTPKYAFSSLLML